MTAHVAASSTSALHVDAWPERVAAELRAEFPGLVLHVELSSATGILTLSAVVAPKRGAGIGSAVMARLCEEADKRGVTVACTPSGDFGGSVRRLKGFYRRFGFRPNSGANRDYTTKESFLRAPCAP